MAVGNNNQIEKRLWDAADEMRANSKLKSSEYSIPVLGLAGDIRQGNTYYEDLHRSTGKFDLVMANSPFTDDLWRYGMRVRQHGHCFPATEAVR
jgi:hypothetical protein